MATHPEVKTYAGGCHCGAVRWHVTTDLGRVLSCNCSICMKVGSLRTFVKAEKFVLEKGEDMLTDYQFAKHQVHHLFCKKCGVHSYGTGSSNDGTAIVCVNVRCFDEDVLAKVTLTNYDGKSV